MPEIGDRRSGAARIGITSLNLVAPGLGLLRLGRQPAAAIFLTAPFLVVALAVIGAGVVPITGYGHAIVALAAVLTTLGFLYLAPLVLSWRGSRVWRPARGWSRWYAVAFVAAATLCLGQLVVLVAHRFYKPFVLPAESMSPALDKDDRLVADMAWRGPLARGTIVLFQAGGVVRVSRIVALPGDRIEMRRGLPVINGVPASQAPRFRTNLAGRVGAHGRRLRMERLPAEPASHGVFAADLPTFDEMPETKIPDGHIFVLGDNRGRSADSRIPIELGGVGFVPLTAIIGRPLYIYWSSDHARIGTRLDR